MHAKNVSLQEGVHKYGRHDMHRITSIFAAKRRAKYMSRRHGNKVVAEGDAFFFLDRLGSLFGSSIQAHLLGVPFLKSSGFCWDIRESGCEFIALLQQANYFSGRQLEPPAAV